MVYDGYEHRGDIDASSSPILQALLDEHAISLQVRCTISPGIAASSRSQAKTQSRTPCTVLITIYGPNGLFEDIGKFFEYHDICLEDPNGCDRNVLYRNPHRLSCNEVSDCLFTSGIDKKKTTTELHDLPAPKDLLEDFNNNEELAEAEQPGGLKTTLERYYNFYSTCIIYVTHDCPRHQKQALTFMLRRESGWTFGSSPVELWEEFSNSHGKLYSRLINFVSLGTNFQASSTISPAHTIPNSHHNVMVGS